MSHFLCTLVLFAVSMLVCKNIVRGATKVGDCSSTALTLCVLSLQKLNNRLENVFQKLGNIISEAFYMFEEKIKQNTCPNVWRSILCTSNPNFCKKFNFI